MLEEIDTVLGGRRPTVADLEKLPWTTACFHESMRYMPPAWAIPRTAIKKDVIDGHPVPKGATVIIPAHAIHHDERFWPEPEKFDPSRFLPENAKGRHRSSYLPFGGGRRICIGTSFALLEATLITDADEPALHLRPGSRASRGAGGNADATAAPRREDDRQAPRRRATGGGGMTRIKEGTRVVITGAGSGIGHATAAALREGGRRGDRRRHRPGKRRGHR